MEFGIFNLMGSREAEKPAQQTFAEVAEQTKLADELGYTIAWFAEHHAHAHRGHLPTPLSFVLHLAGRTRRIQLGAAVVCLNLHHPLAHRRHAIG